MSRTEAIRARLDGIKAVGNQRALIDAARLRSADDAGNGIADVVATTIVQDFLRVAGIYWSEDFAARFSAIPLDVLTPNLFHACALRTDAGPRILVYRGFLKALAYYLELMAMRSGIEDNIAKLPKSVGTREEFNAAKTIAMLPLLMFVAGKRANLPRLGANLCPGAMTDAFNNCAVGLSFIAMHEMGHLELGHLDPLSSVAVVTPALLAQAEDLNLFKLQEFEADSFVFDGMRPEWRHFAGGACTAVLGMLSHIEIYVQAQSDTHPISLNRLQHALVGFGKHQPPSQGGVRPDLTSVTGKLLASIRRRAAQQEAPTWRAPGAQSMESAQEIADFALETLRAFYDATAKKSRPAVETNPEFAQRAKAWDQWADYLASSEAQDGSF